MARRPSGEVEEVMRRRVGVRSGDWRTESNCCRKYVSAGVLADMSDTLLLPHG